MKFIYRVFFFFSIFCFGNFFFQSQTKISDEEIEKKIELLHDDPVKIWKLINFYIKKSKSENNFETLVYAYRYASTFSKYPINIKYADSAISVGKSSNNEKLLTNAYLNRGFVYMSESLYQKALDDIILSNQYSSNLGDDYIIYKTKYLIAQNKIYLGLYEEANKELLECIKYFKNNLNKNGKLGESYQMYYIYSLMSYIDSNTKIGKLQENEVLLAEAFDYIKKNNLNQYLPYFVSCDGVDDYYKKNYSSAIQKISNAIALYNDQWTHITEIYYIGLSHWKLGHRYPATKYFEEIDKEYNRTNKLDPQFRSAYEILIKYNDSIGNKDKQLEYINKLMVLDKSYEKNYKYLYTKINKEYDTQKLLEEKKQIENSLQLQKIILASLLIIALGLFFLYYVRYRKVHKIYKKRFDEIMANKTKDEPVISENLNQLVPIEPMANYNMDFYNKVPGLNPLFVESILNLLNDFEQEGRFLDKQISQRILSEEFNTNSTYLSKIINTYKGKNFTIYINDLRLDYIVELLKTDYKYVNLDVKELANISGFANTENFSDNFQRKFQIKPSYFIKMIKENTKTSAQ